MQLSAAPRPQRLPASVVLSLAAHAGALFLFLGYSKEAPKQVARVVEGVDLLIPTKKPVEARRPKKEISTFDFLKMALPSEPPRRAALQAVDVKLPTSRKPVLADAPKLQDSSRKTLAKLDALDLSRSRAAEATIDAAAPQTRRQAAAALAAMPRLEEVGRRRVKNLPEAIALEDSRREATAMLGASLTTPAPSRRQAIAAAATLAEPERDPGVAVSERKGLSILPEAIDLRRGAEAVAAPKLEKVAPDARLARRQAAAADAPQKKGMEIEGPLADRRIVSYAVPTFPKWAKDQGILEAELAIRFTVDEEGSVMSGMRVQRTSGFGRLDRLAMESLASWKFVPAPGAGAQWGVITFRFLLE